MYVPNLEMNMVRATSGADEIYHQRLLNVLNHFYLYAPRYGVWLLFDCSREQVLCSRIPWCADLLESLWICLSVCLDLLESLCGCPSVRVRKNTHTLHTHTYI